MKNTLIGNGRKGAYLATAIFAISPSFALAAQSLNQAINEQLQTVTASCENLLDGDNADLVLSSGLQAICNREAAVGASSEAFGPSAGNTSSLSSGAQSMLQSARGEAAQAEAIIGNWSLFANIETETFDGDATALADAYDSTATRFNAGANYRIKNNSQIGAALVSKRHQGDYQQGGDFSTDSIGLRLIADMNFGETSFLQVLVGRDNADTDRNRAARFIDIVPSNGFVLVDVSAKPNSNFSYDETEAAALLGTQWTFGGTTLTPSIGLNWQQIDYGTHSETGTSGLEITTHDDTSKSLQGLLGLQANWAIAADWGVWAPQLGARFINEFENKSRQVQVSFTGDRRGKRFTYDTEEGDSSYVAFAAGSVFVLKNGWQFYLNAESYAAYENFSRTVVSGGLRWEL